MERMMPEDIDLVLRREHTDRYEFISPLLSGNVLDIACGIGYGADIVMSVSEVVSYAGRDLDGGAIEIANEHFKKEKVEFSEGDITKIQFKDNSIDSVLSFETLEHLDSPSIAVDEISRVMTPEGIWIGSVPTTEFDDKCENVYGVNPYHVTRFTEESLYKLLSSRFEYVEIFFNQLLVTSSFSIKDVTNFQASRVSSGFNALGSLMFFASNDRGKLECFNALKSKIMPICSVVEYDQERVVPVRLAFNRSETMIVERDQLVLQYETTIESHVESIESHVATIESHLETIQLKVKTIDSLNVHIGQIEAELQDVKGLFLVRVVLKVRSLLTSVLRKISP